MVHLLLVLTLISNSPRILISRQTIGIEIDNSIAFCYATTPLFPLPLFPSLCSPVTLSFITSAPYVIMASVHLLPCLLLLLSLMSLRLLFPCYFVFYILCPLCLPFILSGLESLLCKVFLRTY